MADPYARYVANLEWEVAELRGKVAHRRERDVAVDPGREGLVRAVRRVAMAVGHVDTARALRHLADTADGWADVLDVSPVTAGAIEHSIRGSLRRAA